MSLNLKEGFTARFGSLVHPDYSFTLNPADLDAMSSVCSNPQRSLRIVSLKQGMHLSRIVDTTFQTLSEIGAGAAVRLLATPEGRPLTLFLSLVAASAFRAASWIGANNLDRKLREAVTIFTGDLRETGILALSKNPEIDEWLAQLQRLPVNERAIGHNPARSIFWLLAQQLNLASVVSPEIWPWLAATSAGGVFQIHLTGRIFSGTEEKFLASLEESISRPTEDSIKKKDQARRSVVASTFLANLMSNLLPALPIVGAVVSRRFTELSPIIAERLNSLLASSGGIQQKADAAVSSTLVIVSGQQAKKRFALLIAEIKRQLRHLIFSEDDWRQHCSSKVQFETNLLSANSAKQLWLSDFNPNLPTENDERNPIFPEPITSVISLDKIPVVIGPSGFGKTVFALHLTQRLRDHGGNVGIAIKAGEGFRQTDFHELNNDERLQQLDYFDPSKFNSGFSFQELTRLDSQEARRFLEVTGLFRPEEMVDVIQKPVMELSTGQKHRVGLAIKLKEVQERPPLLLIFDEPFKSVPTDFLRSIGAVIKKISDKTGVMVIENRELADLRIFLSGNIGQVIDLSKGVAKTELEERTIEALGLTDRLRSFVRVIKSVSRRDYARTYASVRALQRIIELTEGNESYFFEQLRLKFKYEWEYGKIIYTVLNDVAASTFAARSGSEAFEHLPERLERAIPWLIEYINNWISSDLEQVINTVQEINIDVDRLMRDVNKIKDGHRSERLITRDERVLDQLTKLKQFLDSILSQ